MPAATFAASSCLQGWRWNLDNVVDLHGNATACIMPCELGTMPPVRIDLRLPIGRTVVKSAIPMSRMRRRP
ncbi:MAG TPA: hypothetical protein VGA04_05515 [Streptosporangiaceae bacterium]